MFEIEIFGPCLVRKLKWESHDCPPPPPVPRPLGSVYNEVPKFIQRYVYRGKKVEGIVKTRMKQYNKTKTQTIQLILLDPNSLTQRSFGSLPIEKAVVLLYSFLFSLVKKLRWTEYWKNTLDQL